MAVCVRADCHWPEQLAVCWQLARGPAGGRGDESGAVSTYEWACDPYAYLKDVLRRLPTHRACRVEELLPHRWQAAQS